MTSYMHIGISPLVNNAHAAGLELASGINENFDISYLHVCISRNQPGTFQVKHPSFSSASSYTKLTAAVEL